MQGLNEKDMQAVVSTFQLNSFYYPTLMPLKENYTLDFKALSLRHGLHIAGDVVARGASIDKKQREALDKIYGDIPKIAIAREKDENELSYYFDMLKLAQGDSRQTELVKAWAEDTEFCFNGVASRVEWLALRGISTGRIKLTSDNNVGPVSEFDFDYDVTKGGVSIPWSNSATATPIDDLKAVVKRYRSASEGIYLKFAWMNADTFDTFTSCAQVQKLCAGYMANIAGIITTPSLEDVNRMLKAQPALFGLQIRVLDQSVTIEKSNGERVTSNPFADHAVMFSESETLGETYWKRPIDLDVTTGNPAVMTMNRHTLIKKYAVNEPQLREVTQGIANVIPVWSDCTRAFLLDSHATNWNIQ